MGSNTIPSTFSSSIDGIEYNTEYLRSYEGWCMCLCLGTSGDCGVFTVVFFCITTSNSTLLTHGICLLFRSFKQQIISGRYQQPTGFALHGSASSDSEVGGTQASRSSGYFSNKLKRQ